MIDSQPVGTHISLERSYTEVAIDQPLRLKYEPARMLADEDALARVDARANGSSPRCTKPASCSPRRSAGASGPTARTSATSSER